MLIPPHFKSFPHMLEMWLTSLCSNSFAVNELTTSREAFCCCCRVVPRWESANAGTSPVPKAFGMPLQCLLMVTLMEVSTVAIVTTITIARLKWKGKTALHVWGRSLLPHTPGDKYTYSSHSKHKETDARRDWTTSLQCTQCLSDTALVLRSSISIASYSTLLPLVHLDLMISKQSHRASVTDHRTYSKNTIKWCFGPGSVWPKPVLFL